MLNSRSAAKLASYLCQAASVFTGDCSCPCVCVCVSLSVDSICTSSSSSSTRSIGSMSVGVDRMFNHLMPFRPVRCLHTECMQINVTPFFHIICPSSFGLPLLFDHSIIPNTTCFSNLSSQAFCIYNRRDSASSA